MLRDWTNGLELWEIIDALYTDYTKAFNSVPHMRLFTKLDKYGIQRNIMGWIKLFLSGRRHRVGVDGYVSNRASVTRGILQCSVLFVIIINYMPSMTSSICKHFADDAKTYRLVMQSGETGILQ